MSTESTADYRKAPPTPGDQKRYRTFEDLEVYQVAREFRKAMCRVNRQLPSFEKFELGSQIRRASMSLTNNIAEGHGRFHHLEQIKFCLNSRDSLEELLDDLNICDDESYLASAQIAPLKQQGWRVHQLLNGYIRWLRERKQGASVNLREDSSVNGLADNELDDLLDERHGRSASTLQPFNASTTPS
jgi:four helix bundle protein